MKKLFLTLITVMLGITMVASADNLVNINISYEDKSLTVSGVLEGREEGFLTGMTVYDADGKLINISDAKVKRDETFAFDKIIFGSGSSLEILSLTIDIGDEYVEETTVIIFEDEDGSGKISNFIADLQQLSDEQLGKYYKEFLSFAGAQTNATYDKLIAGGHSGELISLLKANCASVTTKEEYAQMIKGHILAAAVKSFELTDLYECLFNEYKIQDNADFNSAAYNSLNPAKQEEVITAVKGNSYSSEADVIEGLNNAITTASQTTGDGISSGSGGTGSGGGKGSGGGGFSVSGNKTTIVPAVPQVTIPEKPVLSDIENYWGKEDIESLAAKNIVSGYPDGSFKPDAFVTRAEAASIIKKAFEVESAANKNEFVDVESDAWYYDCINTLFENGIMKGADGYIYPQANLTREDMCVLIYRCINADEAEVQAEFADSSEISGYAQQAVAYLADSGIVKGADGMFMPKKSITRGELCAIVARTLKVVNE